MSFSSLALALLFLLRFDLTLDFANVRDFHYGGCFDKTCSATSSRSGTPSVAFAQDWNRPFRLPSAAAHLQGSKRSSLARLWSPSCYRESHAVPECAVEMHALQAITQTQCVSLPNMPSSLANSHGPHLHPWSQATAEYSAAMELSKWEPVQPVLPGGPVTAQPKISKKVSKSTKEVAQRWKRKGSSRLWTALAVPVLSTAATSWLHAGTALATSKWATSTVEPAWSTGKHDADDEHDAHAHAEQPGSVTECFNAIFCTTGYAYAHDAELGSGTAFERAPQFPSEALCGLAAGCPAACAIGIQETREESHQRPSGSSKVSGGGAHYIGGSAGGPDPTYQFMEILSCRSGEELDGICKVVRAARAGLAIEDCYCSRTISGSQRMPGHIQNIGRTSDGDQRRGGDVGGFGNVCTSNHREYSDALPFPDEALQGSGIDPSGGTLCKATQDRGEFCWRRCQTTVRFQAGFQLGGLHMTLWYCSRKPEAHDLPAVAALKWSHSVLREPDFSCECGAGEAAQKLALEMHFDGLHHDRPGHCSPSRTWTKRRQNLHVGFADLTDLRLSFEDDWVYHDFCLPSCYFSVKGTPWSGCKKIEELKRSRFQVCPWHDGGFARSCIPLEALNGQFSSSSATTEPLHSPLLHFGDLSHGEENSAVEDPCFTGCIASRNSRTASLPGGVTHFKITDNYYDNPARRFQQEPEVPDPDVIPDIHEAPQFAQDLHAIGEQTGIFSDPDSEGVLRLRTWYLHHQHHLVNFHSRTVELEEDWRRWADDIIGSWRTHLHAGASIFFHLVSPDPYRGYLGREFHCDIIITQGNDLPRRAGLTTVHYQGDQLEPHIYAVACSLEIVVSGRRLVEAADADQWCLNARHRCSISIGWQHIPFDFQRVHQVLNGNAFTILITKVPKIEERTSSARANDQEIPQQEHDYDEFAMDERTHPSPSRPRSPSSSSTQPEHEVGVHVYRLDQPDAHCYVRWTDYRHILLDIIYCLGVARNDIVGLHYVQAHPVGIHSENERAIILQSINDIPAASMEQLVLLDIEIHPHALPNGLLLPPKVSRRVMRIHPPIHRSQLLILTGLRDYCEIHGDKCIIFKNNHPWPAHDRTVHALTHGTYIRIQVPPPDDPMLDTETAIAISREFALETDRGQFAMLCRGHGSREHNNNGDVASLFQQSIKAFAASCAVWQNQWHKVELKIAPDHIVHPSIPIGRLGNQPPQPPQRPHSSFHGRDFDTFANLFATGSIIECEEEGPVAYIDTWYIHHTSMTQCRTPRAAKLFQDPASWLEDILEPWLDIIDPALDTTIYLVRPTPPCTQMECILAHFIIEQAPREEQVVGLISIHEANFRGALIDHRAFSLPFLMTERSVIRLADLTGRCSSRSCSVRIGAIPLDPFDPDQVESGTNLVVFIRDHGLAASSNALEDDDVGLMQRPPEPHPNAAGGGEDAGVFAFNPNAAAFCPGQAPLNLQPETIQDLHAHWLRTAFSWEDESASTSVMTWFVDQYHDQQRMCWQPRPVRLYEDFDEWESAMRAAWNDVQRPGAPILFHIVLPMPPNTGPEIAAHVLLVQNPIDTFSSSVITVFEANMGFAILTHQLAITTHEHLLLEHLIFGIGLEGRCLYPGAPSICEAWVGTVALRLGQPHPARDGDGIILQIRPRPNFQQQQVPGAGGVNLLQVGTQLRTGRERRLTHGLVAHTHGPLQAGEDPPLRAIRLTRASADLPPLPSYVEISEPLTSAKVQGELEAFGIRCDILLLSHEQVALCLSSSASFDPHQRHIAYLHQQEPWTVHLHTISDVPLTDLEHMRHLYGLGYEKAVILQVLSREFNFCEIHFTEASGAMMQTQRKSKALPPWPQQQPKRANDRMFHPMCEHDSASCTLNCDISGDDLMNFFTSSRGTLCTSFEDLDLPEVCMQHFSTLAHHDVFDRLIIYADGSSQARSRHIAPQLNEEVGTPDAWCFLVIGETYTSSTTSDLTLIGWSAHQVRCSPDHDWYAGADRIGSAIAEREALFWAMMWRIGQNSNIPTLFRSDSMLALQQARGDIGSLVCDTSFQLLRGGAQLLESALAPGDFLLEHIPGHAGDPFNEFCDWGAKREGSKGFYLPRPRLQMSTWRPLLPFLWMLFGKSAGMPSFQGRGFNVRPPALPAMEPPHATCTRQSKHRNMDFVISIATGNILALGQGPEGFSGKLDFLRAQFQDHHLNFLGVQETRAAAGSSLRGRILRLSSGADKGRGGVELWCNLAQPIATGHGKSFCLARKHFTVAYHDSRRLLVHVQHEFFGAWILVGYAPHSGYSHHERELWWKSTQELLTDLLEEDATLFVCIDANAGPGEADGTHVLLPGFRTSSGSSLLRDFMGDMQLCAPITSDIHKGTTCTWTSPSQEEFTIDYVLIPQNWIQCCSKSCVLAEFALGNQAVDHAVHAIELQWTQTLSMTPASGRSPLGFDRNCIRHCMPQSFISSEVAAWNADVESHLKGINEHFLTQLQRHCPRPKLGPQKPYINPAIWQLRQQKLDHQKELQYIRRLIRRETMARIFAAWKQPSQWLQDQSFSFGTTLWIGVLKHGLGFRRQAAILKEAIRQSKSVALQDVLKHFTAGTAASEIQQQLRPFLGPGNKLKQGMAPLPLVKDAHGRPCTTRMAALNRWIDFFSEMEGGQRMGAVEQRALWRSNLENLRSFILDIPITELPSLTELEHACRQVAAGKASGMDSIPSELLRYCPREVARQLYSLLLKIAVQGQEPLEHKGGYLIPIWKGKLSKDCCQAFRSILISSMVGKTLHKSLRTKQTQLYQRYLHPQQLGGRTGISVVLGGHLIRAFLRVFATQGQPTAVLFIDLQEAFYRVVRPLAISGPWTDELIAAMAHRLHLDQNILQDLYAHLAEPSAVEQAQMSATAQRAIQALHSDTFFALPGQDDRVRTTHGSRPGDSYADVVF